MGLSTLQSRGPHPLSAVLYGPVSSSLPWPPLFAHVQINVPGPPQVLMLRMQAVGMKSCRPRSGLLTWHPSASTADSLLIQKFLYDIFLSTIYINPAAYLVFGVLVNVSSKVANHRQPSPTALCIESKIPQRRNLPTYEYIRKQVALY